MKIKFWQILLFLLIIISATIIVFPNKQRITALFIESGIADKAQYYLSDLLKTDKEDIKLKLLSSEVFQLEGKSNLAILELQRALKKDPQNKKLLERLAILYEWNRNSNKALETWERLAQIDPENKKMLRRLIDYYRYFRLSKKEGANISQLILLEKKSTQPEIPYTDYLLIQLNNDLYELSLKRLNRKDDPNLDTLLSGLYLLRMLYHPDTDKITDSDKLEQKEVILRSLELFVRTGEIEKALSFATNLDNKEVEGIQNRLQLVDIMRWGGEHSESIKLLGKLHQSYPKNEFVLLKMAKISVEIDDYKNAIFAYKKLIKIKPEQQEYKVQLASAYLGTDKVKYQVKAYYLYKELAVSTYTGNKKYLKNMLTVAGYTNNIKIQTDAVETAEKFKSKDPSIIRKIANLYLAINKPEKAYPLFRKLALSSKNKNDIMNMLQAAEYTIDSKIIVESLADALRLMPDDPDIFSKTGDLYMAMELNDKAYAIYRKIFDSNRGNKEIALKMLDAAEFTSKKDIMKEASDICLAAMPEDIDIVVRAAQIYLWTDMPGKAYKLYKNLAVKSRGNQQRILQMILVAELTGKSDLLKEALFLGKKYRPNDLDIRLKIADFYMEQNDQENAIKAYKSYLALNPKDQNVQIKLAQLYIWNNRPEDASKILGKLSRQDRANFEKALAAGNAFLDAKDITKGIAFLERALQLKPDDRTIRRKLADTYKWAGLTKKMVAELEHLNSMGLIVNNDRTLLAKSYMDQNKEAKVIEILKPFERAKELSREEGIMLALSYARTGNDTDSSRIFNRLYKENSEDPKFMAELGNHALWERRTDLALIFFNDALKKEPKNLIALKGSAQVYVINNDTKNAIKTYNTYNKLNPKDYEAMYQLGELYFNNGRKEEAFKQFQKALKLINKLKSSKQKENSGQKLN